MSLPPFLLTHSATGKKTPFEPEDPQRVTFYSCGPTVYDRIHVGNLRSGLVSDLLFRYLKHRGWNVVYARNYTDVDDKIIKRAREEKSTPEAVAKKYISEVELDYAAAGMQEPTHKTLATQHISEMIGLVEQLIQRGHAYEVQGEVLFEVDTFKAYGALSGRNLEDLQAGARVEVDAKKRNPLDFVLWKPSKPGEPSWKSPWGEGRPGWHLECSAMVQKWLGNSIDLHHGGEDLIFPHHENEIAQSQCGSGVAPFARHWVHHAFLNFSSEKMSKSLGNILTARDFLTQTSGEIARYVLLSVHYRSRMEFSDEVVLSAISALQRMYEAKKRATDVLKQRSALPDLRAENTWGEFIQTAERAQQKIEEAYAMDLNTPEAMGVFFGLVREWNRIMSEPRAQGTPSAHHGAQKFLEIFDNTLAPVLGFGGLAPEKALEDLKAARGRMSGASPSSETERPKPEWIESKIAERAEARKAKNFLRGDEIRDELLAAGVVLKDGSGGTRWEYL